MGKRIGESTADDSHCWIFAKLVYRLRLWACGCTVSPVSVFCHFKSFN